MADIDIEALTRATVPDDWSDLDKRAVDTIRVLAAAAVQGAIFALVRAAVDRAGATGVKRLTGSWPAAASM